MRTRGNRLEAHLEAFLEELRLHRYSKGYQEITKRVVALFFSHLRGKNVRDIRSVSEKHVLSFVRSLKKRKSRYGKPRSLWTLSAYVSTLRRFFAFLDKRSVILQNPAQDVRVPSAKRLPRAVLTQSQVLRLLQAPSPTSTLGMRDRAILETFYGTAIRLTECLRLDVSDVDLQSRALWVRDGKGKKDRLLPIPGKTNLAMALYLHDVRPGLVHDSMETAFFLSRTGNRVSRSLIHAMMRNYGHDAGIVHSVSPHALRHACATHLLRRGAGIRHVQELLGHSFIQTTALYTKVDVEDLRKVIARAHPRERKTRKR